MTGVAAAAVLAVGGAAYALSQDADTTETTTCDYAEHYTTVSTLTAHSDLVVAGQVGKKLGTTSGDGGGATDFSFTVTSVLSDPGKRIPQGIGTVKVHQSGTSAGTQCREDPLFTSGSRDVLFLHEYASSSFYVVGGPNGRLIVEGSRVSPFSAGSLQFTGTINDLARQISAGG